MIRLGLWVNGRTTEVKYPLTATQQRVSRQQDLPRGYDCLVSPLWSYCVPILHAILWQHVTVQPTLKGRGIKFQTFWGGWGEYLHILSGIFQREIFVLCLSFMCSIIYLYHYGAMDMHFILQGYNYSCCHSGCPSLGMRVSFSLAPVFFSFPIPPPFCFW